MTTPTDVDLVAFRRRCEASGIRTTLTKFPRSAPAPVTGRKRSMIGYLNRLAINHAVSLALLNGDRDATTYVDAETWLARSGADVGLNDIDRQAVLREPRVKAVTLALLRKAFDLGSERRELIKARRSLAEADPTGNPTLGWRVWRWDGREGCLRSPVQNTEWRGADLRTENWSDSAALRGVAGIHALRVPLDWRLAPWPLNAVGRVSRAVTGVVERFGRYVLGTEGWRAEWVVIRKLRAPSTALGLLLEQTYPEAEIYYEDR